MSCNLERREAADARNPRWQTEVEASNQQRSFSQRTKEAEGESAFPTTFAVTPPPPPPPPHTRKFKQAQQVDAIKRMVKGFSGFSGRSRALSCVHATVHSASYASSEPRQHVHAIATVADSSPVFYFHICNDHVADWTLNAGGLFQPPSSSCIKASNRMRWRPRHLLSHFHTAGCLFFPNTSILFSFHLLRQSAAHRIPCCCPPQVPPPRLPTSSRRVLLSHHQPDTSSIFATRLRSAGGGKKANRRGKQT